MFAFGENNLFNQVSNPPGSMIRKIQEKIQSMIAFAPVMFYGRGVFQYTFGMIPHRRPVHVVGKFFLLFAGIFLLLILFRCLFVCLSVSLFFMFYSILLI